MPFAFGSWTSLLAAGATLLIWLPVPAGIGAQPPTRHAESLDARFRGCESAGWCRFWIPSLDPWGGSLYRVRPDGVSRSCDGAGCVAVRDRLNALLSDMIHQHKHIVLRGLRELDDGTFAAAVTVNGQPLASDPVLVELLERRGNTIR